MADVVVPPGAAELQAAQDGWQCCSPGCSTRGVLMTEVTCDVCGAFADEQMSLAAEAATEIVALEIDAQAAREQQLSAETVDEARAAAQQLDEVLARISDAVGRRKVAEVSARGLDQPHTHPRYWCADHAPEA